MDEYSDYNPFVCCITCKHLFSTHTQYNTHRGTYVKGTHLWGSLRYFCDKYVKT